ncbi:Fic family protein, partial [Candidatus Margulisiibacteriota bacterium]
MNNYKIQLLPLKGTLETVSILKKLSQAHRYLAELKGAVRTIPNELILINTLSLQEAKDSSEIENIITTQDDLYRSDIFSNIIAQNIKSLAAKEVSRYSVALKKGFAEVRDTKLILLKTILSIQKEIQQNNAGIRKLPGTKLANEKTKETIYTPPQDHREIQELLSNLEKYINDDSICDLDPLIKLAIIHFQFESIHPFYDGNGRTGRIINSL